jgi:diacylglycerol kinase
VTNRETLAQIVRRMTGAPRQSEQLKQALRYARGALKSSLASEREFQEHIDAVNKAIAGGAA